MLSRRAHQFWSVGQHGSGLDAGQRALAIAMELDNLPLKVGTSVFLGQLRHARGDYAAAIKILDQVVAWLQGDLAFDRFGLSAPPSIFARTWLAFSLAETGAFAEALAHGAESLRIAKTLDHPFGLYHGHMAVGTVHSLKGDAGPAISALEHAVRIAMASSMPAMAAPAAVALGNAYRLAGRAGEAVPLLRERIEASSQGGNVFLPLCLYVLAQASLLEGQVEEANRAASRAGEVARCSEQRGSEAHALAVLGLIAAQNASPEAEQHYHSALALADELGMRPLVAHCHLGLGKLYRRTDKREQAREHLTTATTMYREMDMRFYLEQAEAEMRGPD